MSQHEYLDRFFGTILFLGLIFTVTDVMLGEWYGAVVTAGLTIAALSVHRKFLPVNKENHEST